MARNLLIALVGIVLLGAAAFAAAPSHAFFQSSAHSSVTIQTSDWTPPETQITFSHLGQVTNLNPIKTDTNFTVSDSHSIQLDGGQAYQLSFSYRINSSELSQGFDEPAFLVKLNGSIIFQDWLTYPIEQRSSDWQTAYLFLPASLTQQLDFMVTNSGDDLYPTAVEIKDLLSSQILFGENDSLTISSEPNSTIFVGFETTDGPISQLSARENISLDKAQLPTVVNKIQIWCVDQFGNTSQPKVYNLKQDLNPPDSISDLILVHQDQQETIVSWTTPEDVETRVDHYLWTLLDDNQQAINPQPAGSHLPYQLSIAKPKGETDWLVFSQVDQGSNSTLEIRAVDQAGNISLPSRIKI